ncbi:hypothetical protein B9Z19DRAFT_1124528 [Tuber borchii]|uniref:Uncharacterized protein n=1 Tax=Tuber borchii TaxID=42251 RepID=A0A2T6ZWH2_TUBBO|nr:hypothetical protein B9Z19DRAFT_1124528 [Tuber borchii]
MAQKLSLQREGETAFMDAYSRRVRELPGGGRFRTGVSLRAPFKEPTELSGSEDRFILFVSFPYFGKASGEIPSGPQRESVTLLDFNLLGLDAGDRRARMNEGGGADIGEVLVHQARYMIFDNYTMATFRSKEDSAKDQVPLHRFQERIGAFRAMIHMISNRMGLELWTWEKLQASLRKLERDIDQMISDAKTYEDNQGMEEIGDDNPQNRRQSSEEERTRQNNVRKSKQRRVRELLASLNSLSAGLFATISVAQRQIAVLQDIHSVFFTSYRTKTKEYEKGYPLRRNPFHRNVAPIPILSENPEQIWPNTLDTVDEVIRERKSFIKKLKELVENMDIRRKILSAFLRSEQANAAPSGKTAQETTVAVKRTEDAIGKTTEAIEGTKAVIKKTQDVIEKTQNELKQQGQIISSFTLVTTVFLPLSFFASYYGMQTVKTFGDIKSTSTTSTTNTVPVAESKGQFWKPAGIAVGLIELLTLFIVIWKRPFMKRFKKHVKNIV